MLRISLVQMLCRVREHREVSCRRESRKRSGPRELQMDLWLSFQGNYTGEITSIDTDVCDEDIQGLAKLPFAGCENFSSKLRQKR